MPQINDVEIVKKLLINLGATLSQQEGQLSIKSFISNIYPDYELVRQIRASLLLMGPILATRKTVKISLPGGCAIGTRPIDLHLKGFEALGARITLSGGNVIAQAKELKGSHIYLDFPSVGATENLMMAAALAHGTTYIENCPGTRSSDLANFINRMGSVHAAGSNVIKIEGRKRLMDVLIPDSDRIEAGTYMVAAAATGGNLLIKM